MSTFAWPYWQCWSHTLESPSIGPCMSSQGTAGVVAGADEPASCVVRWHACAESASCENASAHRASRAAIRRQVRFLTEVFWQEARSPV